MKFERRFKMADIPRITRKKFTYLLLCILIICCFIIIGVYYNHSGEKSELNKYNLLNQKVFNTIPSILDDIKKKNEFSNDTYIDDITYDIDVKGNYIRKGTCTFSIYDTVNSKKYTVDLRTDEKMQGYQITEASLNEDTSSMMLLRDYITLLENIDLNVIDSDETDYFRLSIVGSNTNFNSETLFYKLNDTIFGETPSMSANSPGLCLSGMVYTEQNNDDFEAEKTNKDYIFRK